MAGTASSRISTAATVNTVPRSRAGVPAQRFDALAQASSNLSGISRCVLTPGPPRYPLPGVNGNPAGSGSAPPGYEPILVRLLENT
jgi:hypothetical protein